MLNNPNMEDYSFKRKNLEQAILTFDKNNNFTITLPKFLKEKRKKMKRYDDNKKEEQKSVTKLYKSMDNVKKIKNEQYLKELNLINENLKLTEKEQNILYENLKTKPSFSRSKKNYSNDYNQNTFLTETQELNNNNNNNNTNSKIIKPKFLTPIQREKLQFLNELTIFDDVEKIKLKTKILKDIKLKENRKKFKLHPIDLFHYDEFRWRKQTDDKTIFEKEKKANEIEKDTKVKLVKMKSDVSKVQKIAKDSVQIVEETLKEIENRQKPKEELPKSLPHIETEKRALSFISGNPKSFQFEEAIKIVQSKVRGYGKYEVINEENENFENNNNGNNFDFEKKKSIDNKNKKSSKKLKKEVLEKIDEKIIEEKNDDKNHNDIDDKNKENDGEKNGENINEKKEENVVEKKEDVDKKSDEKKEVKNEDKVEENKNENKEEEKNEENKEN